LLGLEKGHGKYVNPSKGELMIATEELKTGMKCMFF
jgi:hypothetical protein